jgi:L-ascorbate peroxidase
MAASDAAQLKSAREDIRELLKTTYCHPIMVNRKRSLSFFLL